MRGTAAAMKLLAVMVLPFGQEHESMLSGRPPQGGVVTEVGVNVEPSLLWKIGICAQFDTCIEPALALVRLDSLAAGWNVVPAR